MGDPEFALDDLLEAFSTDAHEHRVQRQIHAQ